MRPTAIAKTLRESHLGDIYLEPTRTFENDAIGDFVLHLNPFNQLRVAETLHVGAEASNRHLQETAHQSQLADFGAWHVRIQGAHL